ncbi:MAG: tripartite tricarboxylate transporter permease [Planctomycetota bacterium]|jgi:putative tricarboxylic transport membrane protein|nr:tripartite tricarboxylate transporter permease [Planctomycetota bacterium]
MSTFDLAVQGFVTVCTPWSLFLMLICVAIGIVFGGIPGLSATMAVALFLPVTYGMEPSVAMTMLMALYIGGVSGGLISAILINIPGTPSSVATCFDGHPLAAKGQAAKALGVGIVFSFVGTLISIVALMSISPWLAKLAIEFGNYEFFAIALFSLTMIASLSGDNLVKGVFSGTLGFMFATVGIAPIDSARRFTFGSVQLMSGFDMLTVMIGLFAVGEIIASAKDAGKESKEEIAPAESVKIKGFGFGFGEFLGQFVNMIRSALIGIGIGILPGIGGGTANILAYSVAKNQSRHPEKFGTGIIDGVVASETSNNAAIGGAMVPLLTLGIPGDTVTAMLLGGLMIHGISPGPRLFIEHTDLVYGIFAAMTLATFAMLFLEFYGLRVFVRLLAIPKHILLPVIFCLCGVGAYGLNSRVFDMWSVILFGVLGFGFTVFRIPIAPFILGFILGPMAETNLRRGLMLHKNSFGPLFESPICLLFLGVAALSLALTAIKQIQRRNRNSLRRSLSGRTFNKDGEEEEPKI